MAHRMIRSVQLEKRVGNEGALSIALATVLVLISMAGFGIWRLMREWKGQVETQLRLNRCVGKTAHDLRDHLNAIAVLNEAIEKVRFEISAVEEAPNVALNTVALRQELADLVLKQENERARWEKRTGSVACREEPGLAPEIWPSIHMYRPPADEIGPKPLAWTLEKPSESKGQVPHSFQIRLSQAFRESTAQVQGGSLGGRFNTKLWTTQWGQAAGRTNIR